MTVAYTNFCCRSGGSNLNAGTRTGDTTEPGVAAAFTYTSGTWVNATRVFTVASGNPQADGVAVGDFAALDTGGSEAVYIARVTARDTTTITLAASGHGTNPNNGTLTLRIGGAFKGPNGSSCFPLTIMDSGAGGKNAAGNNWRVNLKNDATYVMTGASTTGPTGGQVQGRTAGYSTAYGDGGEAVMDGGTSGAAYLMFKINSGVQTFEYIRFQNNGASGNASLVQTATANGSHIQFFRCRFTGSRGTGLQADGDVNLDECKFDNNNLSNTGNQGGLTLTGACFATNCRFTNNTGSNSRGVRAAGQMFQFVDCTFDKNGHKGLESASVSMMAVTGCDFYWNGNDGFNPGSNNRPWIAKDCNFLRNGGVGINGNNAVGLMLNCGFGQGNKANVGGPSTNMNSTTELGTVNYTADATPWVDPDNGDFRINLTAAKGTGRGNFYDAATIGYPDIGAAQHQETIPGGPPAPTLAVTDNADGTGGVATISGSDPGSTNAVSVQLVGSTSWTAAGSRAGDGTVNLALAKGYYWVRVVSTLNSQTSTSNVAYLPVTDAADSVHVRASQAIQALVQALSLDGTEARVYRQTLPDENAMEFPAVCVWFNDGEQILTGTNARDDIGYPVHCAIVDRKTSALSVPPDQYLKWRQRIMRRVRHQPLAGVPEVYTVTVVPNLVIDEKLPAYDYLVTAWTFICVSREARG